MPSRVGSDLDLDLSLLLLFLGYEQLYELQPLQLFVRCAPDLVALDLGDGELAGGDVDVCDPGTVALDAERAEVVVALFVEERGLDDGSRRDNARHLTGHDPVHRLIADLVNDGDLVSGVDQLGNVALHCVVGHPGEWDALATANGPGGEDDVAGLGDDLGILLKGLVEIAQAKEDDRLRISGFDLQVLPARRGGAGTCHTGCPVIQRFCPCLAETIVL